MPTLPSLSRLALRARIRATERVVRPDPGDRILARGAPRDLVRLALRAEEAKGFVLAAAIRGCAPWASVVRAWGRASGRWAAVAAAARTPEAAAEAAHRSARMAAGEAEARRIAMRT